jgi:hypothetical protein
VQPEANPNYASEEFFKGPLNGAGSLFKQMPDGCEQGLYLNEAGRRKFLQGARVGRILAFISSLISQTENRRDLITKRLAMFSAIKRLVRKNNGCSRWAAAEHGVVGAGAERLDFNQWHGQLPQFKTRKT